MRPARCIAVLVVSLAGCRSCQHPRRDERAGERPRGEREDDDRETDEGEDRDDARDNFWRVRIVIVGRGRIATAIDAFDCRSDGAVQSGECGPKLVRFHELRPPLLIATGAAGWTFDHWESIVIRPDGTTRPRTTPIPDGPRYVDGFGYADTGELETLTAVFVPASQ